MFWLTIKIHGHGMCREREQFPSYAVMIVHVCAWGTEMLFLKPH